MRIKTTSKTQLFFLEFLVILILFTLTAIVSVGLFAKAKESTENSSDLTYGVMLATNGAENFYAHNQQDEETFYNDSGEVDPNGEYRVVITQGEKGQVETAEIEVFKGDREIYSLNLQDYTGGGVANE